VFVERSSKMQHTHSLDHLVFIMELLTQRGTSGGQKATAQLRREDIHQQARFCLQFQGIKLWEWL
jgi:hypothetical protein